MLKKMSSTGIRLREDLAGSAWFRGWSDDQWHQFGVYMKGLRATSAVFTGVFAAWAKYMMRGYNFPATQDWCKAKRLKTSRYDTSMTLKILESNEFVEQVHVTVATVLRAVDHTKKEEKVLASVPKNKYYPIYILGDNAHAFKKWMVRVMKVRSLPQFAVFEDRYMIRDLAIME